MGGDISEREPGVIAVLGSNSFTGSHFVDYALDNSDARIVGISRSPEYEPVFLPYRYRKAPRARFSFHQLDLNRDCEQVLALLDRERPRVVVNFAAQGEVRNSWRWPDQWFRD